MLGFYELRDSKLPSIPWREYHGYEEMEPQYLWTVRTAILKGDDLNLPRAVGINNVEAKKFADSQLASLSSTGMVVFYPYFVAEKSGTINVFLDEYVIEAVKEDLWNLVTYSKRDVTVQANKDSIVFDGDKNFLSEEEFDELKVYVPIVRSMYREYMLEGKSILLEWSYAYNCDINRNKIGSKYLVFYEVRTV